MGCCQSRMELEETISRCRGRRRYMKQLVKGRQAMAAAHFLYLRSLLRTGSALVRFSKEESPESRRIPPSPPPKAPPSPAAWTPAAPPPPPVASAGWDFWDLFLPAPARDEWSTVVDGGAEVAPPPANPEPAVVVSRREKGLVEIVKELEEGFRKAAEAGNRVSAFLEVPNSGEPGLAGKICGYGRGLSPLRWPWSSKASLHGGFERLGEGEVDFPGHKSTVEKLYAWEKKLFMEAKNAERLKNELEKKTALLRKQEARGVEMVKVEKTKKEVERLQSRLAVAAQAIESTSVEIVRLRESELFPQLLELLTRLREMWKSMHECHQAQTQVVDHLNFLTDNKDSSSSPTSDLRRQATLQLELEVQQWHVAFSALVDSQRLYIHSLAGWLRLSLFNLPVSIAISGKVTHHLTSEMYSLMEEWELALDRIPEKATAEGIKSFLAAIRTIIMQQDDELRQRRRAETAERAVDRVGIDREAAARARAEEERRRAEKAAEVTREMTLNSLRTGFPGLFQAMTMFASACALAFDSIYDHRHSSCDVKMLLP